MGEYLQFTQRVIPERVSQVLTFLGLSSVDEFKRLMDQLLGHYIEELDISIDTVRQYAEKAAETRNIANSVGKPAVTQLTQIMEKSIIK